MTVLEFSEDPFEDEIACVAPFFRTLLGEYEGGRREAENI